MDHDQKRSPLCRSSLLAILVCAALVTLCYFVVDRPVAFFVHEHNYSQSTILRWVTYAPPMGTVVTVHFQHARDDGELDEIVARAEVKHHHYLNFTGGNDAASSRAIGLRFVEFLDPGERIAADRVH